MQMPRVPMLVVGTLFAVPLAYTGLVVAQERWGHWLGRLRGSPAPPVPEVAGGSGP